MEMFGNILQGRRCCRSMEKTTLQDVGRLNNSSKLPLGFTCGPSCVTLTFARVHVHSPQWVHSASPARSNIYNRDHELSLPITLRDSQHGLGSSGCCLALKQHLSPLGSRLLRLLLERRDGAENGGKRIKGDFFLFGRPLVRYRRIGTSAETRADSV